MKFNCQKVLFWLVNDVNNKLFTLSTGTWGNSLKIDSNVICSMFMNWVMLIRCLKSLVIETHDMVRKIIRKIFPATRLWVSFWRFFASVKHKVWKPLFKIIFETEFNKNFLCFKRKKKIHWVSRHSPPHHI